MTTVELFGIYESRVPMRQPIADPYDITYAGRFWRPGSNAGAIDVRGFYDARDGSFVLRFSPEATGAWRWVASNICSIATLRGYGGTFAVGMAAPGDRGPVRVRGTRFIYADQSEYFSVGTTAYAWMHQKLSHRKETLATLAGRGSAFNKLRMTLFPKWYEYNHREPSSGLYPFMGTPPRGWTFPLQFNPEFWENVEQMVGELRTMRIQADLILFHPCERLCSRALSDDAAGLSSHVMRPQMMQATGASPV